MSSKPRKIFDPLESYLHQHPQLLNPIIPENKANSTFQKDKIKKQKIPFVQITVDLNNRNKDQIIIFPNDNILRIAEDFCRKHKLKPIFVPVIAKNIESQIEIHKVKNENIESIEEISELKKRIVSKSVKSFKFDTSSECSDNSNNFPVLYKKPKEKMRKLTPQLKAMSKSSTNLAKELKKQKNNNIKTENPYEDEENNLDNNDKTLPVKEKIVKDKVFEKNLVNRLYNVKKKEIQEVKKEEIYSFQPKVNTKKNSQILNHSKSTNKLKSEEEIRPKTTRNIEKKGEKPSKNKLQNIEECRPNTTRKIEKNKNTKDFVKGNKEVQKKESKEKNDKNDKKEKKEKDKYSQMIKEKEEKELMEALIFKTPLSSTKKNAKKIDISMLNEKEKLLFGIFCVLDGDEDGFISKNRIDLSMLDAKLMEFVAEIIKYICESKSELDFQDFLKIIEEEKLFELAIEADSIKKDEFELLDRKISEIQKSNQKKKEMLLTTKYKELVKKK